MLQVLWIIIICNRIINAIIYVTFVQHCNDINDTRSSLQAVNLPLNLVIRKKVLLAAISSIEKKLSPK